MKLLGLAETASVVDVAVNEPLFAPVIEAVIAKEGLLAISGLAVRLK